MSIRRKWDRAGSIDNESKPSRRRAHRIAALRSNLRTPRSQADNPTQGTDAAGARGDEVHIARAAIAKTQANSSFVSQVSAGPADRTLTASAASEDTSIGIDHTLTPGAGGVTSLSPDSALAPVSTAAEDAHDTGALRDSEAAVAEYDSISLASEQSLVLTDVPTNGGAPAKPPRGSSVRAERKRGRSLPPVPAHKSILTAQADDTAPGVDDAPLTSSPVPNAAVPAVLGSPIPPDQANTGGAQRVDSKKGRKLPSVPGQKSKTVDTSPQSEEPSQTAGNDVGLNPDEWPALPLDEEDSQYDDGPGLGQSPTTSPPGTAPFSPYPVPGPARAAPTSIDTNHSETTPLIALKARKRRCCTIL